MNKRRRNKYDIYCENCNKKLTDNWLNNKFGHNWLAEQWIESDDGLCFCKDDCFINFHKRRGIDAFFHGDDDEISS